MEDTVKKSSLGKKISVYIFFIVIFGCISYGSYRGYLLYIKTVEQQQTISDLHAEVQSEQTKNTELVNALGYAQNQLSGLDGQIKGISNTVGTLQKLSQTDPELLKKYSKIFFLNENYLPVGLTEIDPQFLYDKAKPLRFLTGALPHLNTLLNAAKGAGLSLEVLSSYRSFSEQSGLKSTYAVVYGSGANKFSADQGYSEHQLGTALDFTNPKVKATFTGFQMTSEYTWLKANAWQYGFIESYPPNNKYYIYEPWHWRYVGTALSTKIHNDQKEFYNLDQREIDTYLINFFE